jgi:hypothetical protein
MVVVLLRCRPRTRPSLVFLAICMVNFELLPSSCTGPMAKHRAGNQSGATDSPAASNYAEPHKFDPFRRRRLVLSRAHSYEHGKSDFTPI